MDIQSIIDGDFVGAGVQLAQHVSKQASDAGKTALQAMTARMKSAGPQTAHDTHGPAGGQNYGREADRRKEQHSPTPANEPGR